MKVKKYIQVKKYSTYLFFFVLPSASKKDFLKLKTNLASFLYCTQQGESRRVYFPAPFKPEAIQSLHGQESHSTTESDSE